ncbi:uncharacterized protein LOC120420282 [Culex pipiens pallens]|uniref:uncharacterized protein LOC120420282 n=1 Tax=Culex pipiens pallens TaxID=42434 RepID=UPI00195463D2|nr:uncharacterized protein LOC120420282 [Culex pipiens pallens]
MNTALLLWSVLLLAPVALAHAPTGCVTIKNRHMDKYLVSSSSYDSERRHVSLDKTGNQHWVIRQDGINYRITHGLLKEELYESDKSQNGNFVFLWTPRDRARGRGWRITQSEQGFFHIKNVKYGHCLYAKGMLSNWIGAYANCDSKKYEWKIVSTSCRN